MGLCDAEAALTTLDLARALADAVLLAGVRRSFDNTLDAPTQAVIGVLAETGHGFCRYGEVAGLTTFEAMDEAIAEAAAQVAETQAAVRASESADRPGRPRRRSGGARPPG